MRKDNLVIFTTEQGNPCDTGARTLAYNGKLPRIRNATVGRAKVIRDGSRYLVALIIKNSVAEIIEREMVTEAIAALLDVTLELDLRSLSICKGNVDNVPWININNILCDTFRNLNVRIFACTNQITIPLPADRPKILEEYHASMVGGHKGITKTYLRLKNRYYWPNMKTNI